MKKLICTFVLALPLMALPTQAQAGGPLTVSAGFSLKLWGSCSKGPYCDPCCGYGYPVQLGPWYSYWPYEAHFQTPAYPQFPYWPAPMTSGIPAGYANPYQTPAGSYAGAPSYWYGR